MALIEVDRLTIGWGDVVLHRELCFAVEPGDVFGILGGSGSGKSTLLRHMIGLARPMAGSVRIDGRPLQSPEDSAPPFGVLFQSGALFGSMTLLENVSLPLRRWTALDEEGVAAVARARLRLVALDGFENHLPAEISGGMKKRAGIARAMALEPAILFLDEPSAGLDPISAVELDELILTLSRSLDVTTVLVSHELNSIFKIANRCIMLDKAAQGIIAEGQPTDLRDTNPDPRVHHFFNRLPAPAAGDPA